MWGFLLTVAVYIGCKKITQTRWMSKVPVILLAAGILIALILLCHTSYESYNESACWITWILGPATVAFAWPLSQNLSVLKRNKRAVYGGLLFSCLCTIGLTYLLGRFFHAENPVIFSMLPKSVTTPAAVEISKDLGGIPELTACLVVLTGLLGGLTAHGLFKFLHIRSHAAIGVSIGATSHVLGTSKCAEKHKEKQMVLSTLALIIMALLTALAAPHVVAFLEKLCN